jgi:hypothetical protein
MKSFIRTNSIHIRKAFPLAKALPGNTSFPIAPSGREMRRQANKDQPPHTGKSNLS